MLTGVGALLQRLGHERAGDVLQPCAVLQPHRLQPAERGPRRGSSAVHWQPDDKRKVLGSCRGWISLLCPAAHLPEEGDAGDPHPQAAAVGDTWDSDVIEVRMKTARMKTDRPADGCWGTSLS